MGRIDEAELRRRAVEGVREEVEAFSREEGMTTASLQASKAGAPLYERIGFRDLGFVEMWELRR